MISGRLEQIWTKRFHRGQMDAIPRADLRTGVGLVDNADQSGARQVAVISKERWGPRSIPCSVANLLVSGIELRDTRGGYCASARSASGSKVRPARASAWTRPTGVCAPRSEATGVAAPTPKWSTAVRSASGMRCAGNPRAPARETRAVRHRSASALAAKTKSLSVRPLILWVQIVTFTLPQVRKMSG